MINDSPNLSFDDHEKKYFLTFFNTLVNKTYIHLITNVLIKIKRP